MKDKIQKLIEKYTQELKNRKENVAKEMDNMSDEATYLEGQAIVKNAEIVRDLKSLLK